jgi:hypothetical protein
MEEKANLHHASEKVPVRAYVVTPWFVSVASGGRAD